MGLDRDQSKYVREIQRRFGDLLFNIDKFTGEQIMPVDLYTEYQSIVDSYYDLDKEIAELFSSDIAYSHYAVEWSMHPINILNVVSGITGAKAQAQKIQNLISIKSNLIQKQPTLSRFIESLSYKNSKNIGNYAITKNELGRFFWHGEQMKVGLNTKPYAILDILLHYGLNVTVKYEVIDKHMRSLNSKLTIIDARDGMIKRIHNGKDDIPRAFQVGDKKLAKLLGGKEVVGVEHGIGLKLLDI